jgi:hypothetical protein
LLAALVDDDDNDFKTGAEGDIREFNDILLGRIADALR